MSDADEKARALESLHAFGAALRKLDTGLRTLGNLGRELCRMRARDLADKNLPAALDKLDGVGVSLDDIATVVHETRRALGELAVLMPN